MTREDISIQKLSNLIRLTLLVKYGGIWVDTTVYCCKSINDWLPEYMTQGFFTFRNPGIDRMFSSWFIAASPKNIILQTLYREYADFFVQNTFPNLNTAFANQAIENLSPLLNSSIENTLLWHSEIIIKGLKIYPYFILHYTFNKMMLEHPECRLLWDASKEFDASEPHYLQSDNNIDNAIEHINSKLSPMYKLNWRVDNQSPYWSTVLKNLSQL